LGFEHDEALTLGRAVAGLNAHSKGISPLFGGRQDYQEIWKIRRHIFLSGFAKN